MAMVVAQDTDYLLLDEPLNNLDMRHSQLTMKSPQSSLMSGKDGSYRFAFILTSLLTTPIT